mmetsp:Transcript_28345/g.83405  ORF Transcript_28345/g.83405 Transcript_28345/m.83405 type:complete len:293 (-) Transcript_28345:217-1095(-)
MSEPSFIFSSRKRQVTRSLSTIAAQARGSVIPPRNMTSRRRSEETFIPPPEVQMQGNDIPSFRGEWDAEGVYVYQAYRPEIADWALEHQSFGGPTWKPTRMTWIKPSFGWMLYRSGYGGKSGQAKVLKIKLSHETMLRLLSDCKCVDSNRETQGRKGNGATPHEGGGNGRVQWDPERDLFSPEQGGRKKNREPRRMLRRRAIQIGLAGNLSEHYANQILSIEDVSDLAREVGSAHGLKKDEDVASAMDDLRSRLPDERQYLPDLPKSKLIELAMLPGPAAERVAQLGRGRAR